MESRERSSPFSLERERPKKKRKRLKSLNPDDGCCNASSDLKPLLPFFSTSSTIPQLLLLRAISCINCNFLSTANGVPFSSLRPSNCRLHRLSFAIIPAIITANSCKSLAPSSSDEISSLEGSLKSEKPSPFEAYEASYEGICSLPSWFVPILLMSVRIALFITSWCGVFTPFLPRRHLLSYGGGRFFEVPLDLVGDGIFLVGFRVDISFFSDFFVGCVGGVYFGVLCSSISCWSRVSKLFRGFRFWG